MTQENKDKPLVVSTEKKETTSANPEKPKDKLLDSVRYGFSKGVEKPLIGQFSGSQWWNTPAWKSIQQQAIGIQQNLQDILKSPVAEALQKSSPLNPKIAELIKQSSSLSEIAKKMQAQSNLLGKISPDLQESAVAKALRESSSLNPKIAELIKPSNLISDYAKDLQAQQTKLSLLTGGLKACDAARLAQSAAQLVVPVKELSKIKQEIVRNPESLPSEFVDTVSQKIKTLEDNSDSADSFSSDQVTAAANTISYSFIAQLPTTINDISKNIILIDKTIADFATENRDSIEKLIEVSKKNIETISLLLEISKNTENNIANLLKESKQNFESSAKNEQAAMKLSKWAIIISVLGILISAIIQCYFSYRAEKRDGTAAIIKAIENNGLGNYSSEINSANFHAAGEAFQIILNTMKQNVVLAKQYEQQAKILTQLQQERQDALRQLDNEKQNHKISLQKVQQLEKRIVSAQHQIDALEKSLRMLTDMQKSNHTLQEGKQP